MKRTYILLIAGTCVALIGAFLGVRADALATRWEPIGRGAWGGRTDVTLRATYQMTGMILSGFGLLLVAGAAWNWMHGEREPARTVPLSA